MCHNIRPSLTIIMENGNQYFKKKIILMFKKFHSTMCEDSDFDVWMTINDVNMASWVQL